MNSTLRHVDRLMRVALEIAEDARQDPSDRIRALDLATQLLDRRKKPVRKKEKKSTSIEKMLGGQGG